MQAQVGTGKRDRSILTFSQRTYIHNHVYHIHIYTHHITSENTSTLDELHVKLKPRYIPACTSTSDMWLAVRTTLPEHIYMHAAAIKSTPRQDSRPIRQSRPLQYLSHCWRCSCGSATQALAEARIIYHFAEAPRKCQRLQMSQRKPKPKPQKHGGRD